MATVPDSAGPKIPQDATKLNNLKHFQRSDSLILQRIRKEDIQQKPNFQVGKENFASLPKAEMKATAKAACEMAKSVKAKSNYAGIVRGLLGKRM